MSTLKLSKNLSLPLDFATERIAFLARTGAGKSGGMRVMFEQMFDAGIFSIFIDPKGDAWGIRAAGLGKGKSVLIMGGDYADVPLQVTAGKVVAEFLVKERVSTVLDISDFSTPDMWKFVADFTKTLYKLNRDVLHLFIDEADMIAGQTYFDPHCLHGIQLIQNKGRGRGFGVTVATQRPQILNKTVLNASGTLVAMQTIGDDAIKVVKSWFSSSGTKEALDEVLAALPTMQTREAFVYSPQTLGVKPTRIRFNDFQTFDSMRTPKPGETRQAPKSVADIDLKGIQQDMAATIEEAKANDPKLLKGRIAVLEKELSLKNELLENAPKGEVEIKEVEVPVFPHEAAILIDNVCSSLAKLHSNFEGMAGQLANDHDALRKQLTNLKTLPESVERALPSQKPTPKAAVGGIPYHAPSSPSVPFVPTPGKRYDGDLSPLQKRIINGLGEIAQFGKNSPHKKELGFFIGSDLTGGAGSTASKFLVEAGLVDGSKPGHLSLTVTGTALIDPVPPITSRAELHDRIRQHLDSGLPIRIFDALLIHYPAAIHKKELGPSIGSDLTGGAGSTAVKRLVLAGILESPKPGFLKASDAMFPEGLR